MTPHDDDSIERARLEREARERAESRRDPRKEDSDPPVQLRAPSPPSNRRTFPEFPPASVDVRPDGGFPQPASDSAHPKHKGGLVAVWGSVAVIVSAAGGGAGVVLWFGDKLAKLREDITEIKQAQAVNQAVVQLTLTNQGKDIGEIKDALKIAKNPESLTPEKKPPEKPHR